MASNFSKWRRRDFLRGSAVAAAGSLVCRAGIFGGAAAQARPLSRTSPLAPVDAAGEVKPGIGTGWHGHTFPGAVAPFGMVQLSPDTSGPPEVPWNGEGDLYAWDHCSGYHYRDNVILGFSHTHVQGTGGPDLGDVLLMPLVENRNWSWNRGIPGNEAEAQSKALGTDSGWVLDPEEAGYFSWFSHDQETMRPGYYSVHLDTPGVHGELTATTRCGMHRYQFPAGGSARCGLMLDLIHSLGSRVYEAGLTIETPSRVSGYRYTHGWAQDKQVYFVMEVSRPAIAIQVKTDGTITSGLPGSHFSGTEVQAIFNDNGSASEPLLVRVGISGTGIEGARKNLRAEIPHWDFNRIAHQTAQLWQDAISTLETEIPDSGFRQAFYTGAYHAQVAPATFNDTDGAYRGQDRRNYSNPSFRKYTTLSIWDIYRGQWPLMMLMQPHRTRDVMRTMLADYNQLGQHSLPMWPLWGNETWSMTGFHSVGMIAAAYARGFRDFDAEATYAAILDTALAGAAANGNKQLQEEFRHYGYVPSGDRKQSVSRTLDFAYDYWSVGAMAEMMGRSEDAQRFYRLGRNYRNLFDPASGFMRGKTEDGHWREPFRPDREYWEDYTESDAWQATFNVMHDVQGLIELYGGDTAFIAKLDALFAAPSGVLNSPPDITGMTGQDAQGNEPSNHIPYLYPFAGAAWKTQYWVRRIMRLYNNTPAGIPGNDDCGQISSWIVFAGLGFYPVNAVTGVYVIGSPAVQRAHIHNPVRRTTFSIVADNNSPQNIYIQSAQLNGRELTRSWITNNEVLSGGELHFRMGSRPNKEWASAPEDRPPSGLIRTSPAS